MSTEKSDCGHSVLHTELIIKTEANEIEADNNIVKSSVIFEHQTIKSENQPEIKQSKVESQEKNKIKQEALELEDEMPIFESDSTYLNNEIKQEIVPQSTVDFRYEIKREEFTLDDLPNFEMDSSFLDKTMKEEIKLEEPL